jgi:acyl carrier protein
MDFRSVGKAFDMRCCYRGGIREAILSHGSIAKPFATRDITATDRNAPFDGRRRAVIAFNIPTRGHSMQQRQRIKHYILKNFLFSNDDSAIGDQDSLVRGAILDSTGIYELIMFIEEEFKFTINPEEMTPDNFDTLEVMDAFVTRKLAG